MSAPEQDIELDGRRLALTSLDKVLWPRAGFTKGEMIDYYRAAAPALVPHLAGRPLTLGRFPDGVDGPGFAQNECRGRPDWMATQPVVLRTGVVRNYCVVDDAASLVWVANLGTLELHPYLARGEHPDHPTAVAIDLDPHPPRDLADCCRVALRLRELLAADGLEARPKTSGAAGLHVFVPTGAAHPYAETKAYARAVAGRLAAELPELVSDSTRPREREGRVHVDWLQNAPRRSTVAPYSLRATDWPTVSTPVTWDDVVAAAGGAPLRFMAKDALDRLERLGDLFAPVLSAEQRLPGS